MPVSPDEITRQYADAVTEAKIAYENASTRLNQAQEFLDSVPDVGDVTTIEGQAKAEKRREYSQRVDTLQKAYASAQTNYVDTLHQRADAVNKAKADADPATTARLEAQAKADIARANQIQAESDEFTSQGATQERRDAAAADARLKKAQADEAEYGLALAKETDPAKREAAQAALDRARADTARVQAETAQVGKPTPQTPEQQRAAAAAAATAEANAAVAPTVAAATATTAQANATTAQAAAAVAPDLATTNLAKAQSDLATANQNLTNAQTEARQKPTDAQAQQAVQNALRQQDLTLKQLEAAIAQAKDVNPIAVEQAKATLEQTRANTQKGLQGDLYGRQEQIRQIKALVQSGDVSPAEGDLMVNALNRGTSVYQAQTQQQADRSTARGQDLSNKNALAGNLTSAMTSGFSTLADMNKYATKGSTAGADAFLGLLNIAQDRLKSYELPPAQTTDYLSGGGGGNLSGLIGAAQQAVQPVQQPQPVVQQPQPVAAAPAGGPTGINITINQPHPADQTQGALQSVYQPESSAASSQRNLGGLVSTAAQKVPASEEDIYQAYGVNRPGGGGVM